MWLNYLIWCNHCNRIIPGDHHYFEWSYLESLDPGYMSFLEFYIHHRDYSTATIRLGSHGAWLNFYLNLNAKKGMPKNYGDLVRGADMLQAWHKEDIDFNLDWCLIFEDPEKFITQLNSISNFDVQLNSVTEQAFEQYKKSCIPLPDADDPQINAWRRSVLNFCTDRSKNLIQRSHDAEEMLYNTYYKI